MNSSVPDPSSDTGSRSGIATIPNLLCLIRLAGAFVMVGLAAAGEPMVFLGVYLICAATDWVDGKLAVALGQQTTFGAKLDTWADAAMYAGLLIGLLWLRGEIIARELPWIVPAVGMWAVAVVSGLLKFRRWPGYHTRMAKASWFLVTVAVVCLLAEVSLLPLRFAMLAVFITNMEQLVMTLLAEKWVTDVGSLYLFLKDRPDRDQIRL